MTTPRPSRPRKSILRMHWESAQQDWQLWLLLFLVGCSLLGGMWLTKGTLLRTAEIPTWPTTSAQIKNISIKQQKTPNDPLDIQMELAYEVQKKQYLAYYRRSWLPSPSQQDPHQWEAGSYLTIRYQPSDPQIISLFPEGP